jgi:hypothetical protein
MENKKILLPNKKYIGSPDKDIQIKLGIENKIKNNVEGSYGYTINSYDQYKTERYDSDLFRTYLKVSGMYYSNGLNNPLISNYGKGFNTNYFINKQEINNPNDPRNFSALRAGNSTYTNLSTPDTLPFNFLVKDSNPSGYDIYTYTFTSPELTVYTFGSELKINLKNTDVVNHNFDVKINFIKNITTTPETVYSEQIFSGNINSGSIVSTMTTISTSGITLDINETITMQIEDISGDGNYVEYSIISTAGFTNYYNKFYGVAQGFSSLDKYLSNIDFLYDPLKVVTNTSTTDSNTDSAKSVIFSITAPYDDIIITNISPLTTISSEQTVELIDYWYLPTDIKRDGSYNTTTYSNISGEPIIVSASTGWINIGKFLTGTTETEFSNSNVLRTNLFTFRGNMNIKIPKYQTYSFFITLKNGDEMTTNELLKTSYGYDSVAGFMGLPVNMANGDIKSIKDYQQYCWLNIWPDSYELSAGTTTTNVSLLASNVSYRDYYGWSNNFESTNSGNPYVFQPKSIVSGTTNTYAFKGVVNYKLVEREPYSYRTQKLLSYNDYYDSVVPSKPNLEYLNDGIENWDVFSAYSYDKDDTIELKIFESGLTNTFIIGDGIPAKYNMTLSSFEISASTSVVFSSYFDHNLKVGDYVKVKQISGVTKFDLGVFPVVSVGSKNNSVSDKLVTIKLTGFTGNYIQFKRFLKTTDEGSLSQYYIRKYKIIENSNNYTLTTPLSKNAFGNNSYYLTNTNDIDISGLYDENNFPVVGISYFFKKKDIMSTTFKTINKVKNKFYDEYYGARSGFISRELLTNNTNFFINGASFHDTSIYTLGLMSSGLTNTYRNGSITTDGSYLSDDVFVFDCDTNINIGTHIEFVDTYYQYSGVTALTQSIIYRKGDDFNYNNRKYFSLFSQFLKKPISNTSGDTLTLLGVKPTLSDYGSSQIMGSALYPGKSMVLINNQLDNFPIGNTIYFSTGSTDTLTMSTVLGYEMGGLYAVIDNTDYGFVPTTGYTNVYTLQYYGNSYNIKISDLMFEHYVVYYLGDYETKLLIGDNTDINDFIYGDIVEFNQRDLNTNVLQSPSYLFKLKDLYGYTGSTTLSATTATYGKTDLLYPITFKYFTNTVYSTTNVEDKKSWAIFNDSSNNWEWRDLIPNGDLDESGRGSNFPFLNGRHYIYNDIIMPFRSRYWNPIYGNRRSLSYNSNYNYSNGVGTLQSINNIDIC